MPAARLEWNNAKGSCVMKVCHHDCSFGINVPSAIQLADIILDQGANEIIYKRLHTIPESHGLVYKPECERVLRLLFAE